jgi:hypothetical protein
MRVFEWLREKESRFAWSLLGFVVGVLSLLISYFTSVERRPHVVFTVLADTNVLDLHTALPDLKILFRDVDLQRQQLNLRVITVRVQNTGAADVLPTQYDDAIPWGFHLPNAELLQVRILGSNSKYLLERVVPSIAHNSITLNKVILEHGSYFDLETLFIHPRTRQPLMEPIGKIAGVAFTLTQVKPTMPQSLVTSALDAPWHIQIVRFAVYGARHSYCRFLLF